MAEDEPPLAMHFTVHQHRPAVEIPACPALGMILTMDCAKLDSWLLAELESRVRAVLDGRMAGTGVGQDEVHIDIEPDRVEFAVSSQPDGTWAWQGALSTRRCLEAIERWKLHLAAASPGPAKIGVGKADWIRPPLPPNRTGGSPASGFPVSGPSS